jgi:hypothetical protein
MKITEKELKIITNYLEFDNHIPNLDSEDRVKLLNRFRKEMPVNELNIDSVVGQSEQFYCIADKVGAAGDCKSQCESCKETGK